MARSRDRGGCGCGRSSAVFGWRALCLRLVVVAAVGASAIARSSQLVADGGSRSGSGGSRSDSRDAEAEVDTNTNTNTNTNNVDTEPPPGAHNTTTTTTHRVVDGEHTNDPIATTSREKRRQSRAKRRQQQRRRLDSDNDDDGDDDDDDDDNDDDPSDLIQEDDDDPVHSNEYKPTEFPTSPGSSIWEDIDGGVGAESESEIEIEIGDNEYNNEDDNEDDNVGQPYHHDYVPPFQTDPSEVAIYQYPYELPLPPNSITLHISLAFVQCTLIEMQDRADLVCMVLKTITEVLNNYNYEHLSKEEEEKGGLPFVFTDEEALAEFFQQREEEEANQDSDEDDDDRRRRRRRRNTSEREPRFLGSNNNDSDSDSDESSDPVRVPRMAGPPHPPHHVAKVKLHDVSIHMGNHDWWSVAVVYTVWRRPRPANPSGVGDGNQNDRDLLGSGTSDSHRVRQSSRAMEQEDDHDDNDDEEDDNDDDNDDDDEDDEHDDEYLEDFEIAVRNELVLKRIMDVCRFALDDSLSSNLFWETLGEMEFDFGTKDLILNKLHFCPKDMGLANAQAPGDEYDLKQQSCLREGMGKGNRKGEHHRSHTADSECAQCDFTDLDGLGAGEGNAAVNDLFLPDPEEEPYKIPIAESIMKLRWGPREWAGLGMMVVTTLWVGIASLVAHFVAKKRNRQRLWGAALTAEGVDELLQVDWRIVEEQPPPPQPSPFSYGDSQQPPQPKQQPQHYLQIYDKGIGPGYNDENSLLQGGFERLHIDVAVPRTNQHNHFGPASSTTAPPSSSDRINNGTSGGPSEDPLERYG